MRIRSLAVALAIFAVNAADAREWTKVRIGTEGAYPPFNFLDTNNQLQGFEIDIAKALCTEMKVECEFIAQDWDGIIPGLMANKYDAIMASMSITDERRQQIAFSTKYYSTLASFVAANDSKITSVTPTALKGMRLGGQSSTTHATFLEEVYGKAGATIRLYATQDEANLDLSSGRLDAVIADKIVLLEWLEKTDEGKCCRFVGEDVNDPKYFGEGVGIGLRKTDTGLKARFDKAIKAIRANGTYRKINDKYFPFDVF